MSATHSPPTKRDTLNLRVQPDERDLIDRAAAARGQNRTDFILSAARAAAEETLLEATLVRASPDAYAAFVARLDAPPAPNPQLRRTMRTPAPWDGSADPVA
ncbi:MULTISPECIES: DUF1778 domain-containing protein [Burkholderia]|uniref:type II toxin-antitoxin system TacA family antitoxin n=1 Tax=Burkholderia TaxID=32008 RepID=UPI000B7A584D|nr:MULTISPECIES: DUF1778 domain-containing protein [Burkholderia]MBY4721924.1 DUF1778 domain-containing protein [Burkholderia contaminans]MCI3967583.1 DUF1778 domain-containing protein [Burkholderia sp. HI4860]MDN7787934.1 DUF1778 domain-containing protein [Burkholderia contaminans]OXI97929.1 CopG family transcriptional regulator [Burkholderia sp. AU33647]OXJ13573.1 CopG family transcriptional regulator [Burkholderia sp. AU6039]